MDSSALQSMIRARGLELGRLDPFDDLLLPPSGREEDLEAYLALLDHYAVRLLLKEVIKSRGPEEWRKGRKSLERFCQPGALDDFLLRLADLGVLRRSAEGFPTPSSSVRSFGATYEWYVAHVIRRDFSCPAAWGVRFENMASGGDHDVVAHLSGYFLYIEVKTAPPKHIEPPEIAGFVRRLRDIAPDIAIFHDDTHLRMKDKIVPLMTEALGSLVREGGEGKPEEPSSRDHPRRFPAQKGPRGGSEERGWGLWQGTVAFRRLEREIFHLNSCLYIVNSKPDLKRNLSVVFRHFFRSRNPFLQVFGD
ncbi:MAG: hypothetical protein JSV00_04130 [bacterium]|nr:MAG: hypothetical protein JSV00_04130 [bacterium]